jgi:hypothetical protein
MYASLHMLRLNMTHGITCDVCELRTQVVRSQLRGRLLERIMVKYERHSVSRSDDARVGGRRSPQLLII